MTPRLSNNSIRSCDDDSVLSLNKYDFKYKRQVHQMSMTSCEYIDHHRMYNVSHQFPQRLEA